MNPPANVLHGKILVVDDQEPTARLITEMLQDAGYTDVAYTTRASEVRGLHQAHGYDLIVLDLQMPGTDGFHVMEELSTLDADDYLPVLAVTAEPALKLHALKAGAKDFIAKPFDPEEALTRIRNMLEVRLRHGEVRTHARRLEALAMHDALTGLANRRLMSQRISAALANARRSAHPMAVLFLDLDGFKMINDTLGHGAGDALLKMVAERLSAQVRAEDTVGRLGGDEFVIALWDVRQPGGVNAVAAKLIQAVSVPYLIDGQRVSVTTSAGIAIYPTHGCDAAALMERADAALYVAKRAGKNAFRIADQPEAPARG